MNPITFIFMLLVALGLDAKNKAQDEYIDELHTEIMDLEAWKYRVSGELADVAGKENMNNTAQQEQIDALVREALSEN